MRTFSKLCAGIVVMAITLYAQADSGESIVLDPTTGNYTITYGGDSTNLSQTVFVPATKIDPTIRSSFRLNERDVITYRYTVFNGATAKQAIIGIVLKQIANPIIGELPFPDGTFPNLIVEKAAYDAYNAAVKTSVASPLNWDGDITRRLSQVDWSPNTATYNTGGIHPGQTLSGFGFNSLDLPGISQSSWMNGRIEDNEIFGFPDDGPDESSPIFAQLNQLRDNDFIIRNTAVPMIAVPVPFDAATLLDRIRSQMFTWSGTQLINSAFATQLDRYMVAAANAYRSNQPKVGKEQIESVRKLLEHEHNYLDHDEEDHEDTAEHKAATRLTIDRLAARVLDFDLRYVLKRMEREHEHDHDEGDRRKEQERR
ncbi:hypothetical protein GALL_33320 [mine drainage metagenome]|uniref:Uncharacterized protein n=1 Tax=mine drainage metagenome TaxID=410659 RepID=A0A1J5T4R7_9ZZZZ